MLRQCVQWSCQLGMTDHNTGDKTVQTITITNVMEESDADGIKAALNGKTYMNLAVETCPVGGSLDVTVTGAVDTEEELTGMVMDVMARAL